MFDDDTSCVIGSQLGAISWAPGGNWKDALKHPTAVFNRRALSIAGIARISNHQYFRWRQLSASRTALAQHGGPESGWSAGPR